MDHDIISDLRQEHRQGVKRHRVTVKRDCPLGTISCHDLTWKDYQGRLIDYSVIGVGIETDDILEPGLIWFRESIFGHSCGYVVWSRQQGSFYRSGVQFISLPRAHEEYLRRQVNGSASHQPLQDPERIIDSLMDNVKKRF